MTRILIIGYGNPLRGDDGFGWQVADRLFGLFDPGEADVLKIHQLTPELMEAVSVACEVILVDAAVGTIPGEIRERPVTPAPAAAMTHHISPEALLAGARTLYGRAAQARLITVTGGDFSYTTDLSPPVERQVEEVVRRIREMVEAAVP